MTDATQAMQPPTAQPFAAWNPTRGIWGDNAARPLRALGAVLGDLADFAAGCTMDRLTGFPCRRSSPTLPHLRPRPAHCSAPAGDGLIARWRRLDQVRARRGTIALSHQIIDFASTDRVAHRTGEPNRRRCGR